MVVIMNYKDLLYTIMNEFPQDAVPDNFNRDRYYLLLPVQGASPCVTFASWCMLQLAILSISLIGEFTLGVSIYL